MFPKIVLQIVLFLALLCASIFPCFAQAEPASQDVPSLGRVQIGAPQSGSRGGVLAQTLHRIRTLMDAPRSASAILLLVGIAAIYGIFHALGPGHQKTLVSGYLLAEGGGIFATFRAATVATTSHALSITFLFLVLFVLDAGLTGLRLRNAGALMTRISGGTLLALSLFMLVSRLLAAIRAWKNHEAGTVTCSCSNPGHSSSHTNAHEHNHDGNRQEGQRKWRSLPLLIIGSLTPCPGAAILLLYGVRGGNFPAGLAAIAGMSAGMWLTLLAVGFATVCLRTAGSVGLARTRFWTPVRLHTTLSLAGSVLVTLFAFSLLFQTVR